MDRINAVIIREFLIWIHTYFFSGYNFHGHMFCFRRWFNVILEEADEGFATQILPAMLDRSGLLFDLSDCKADVIM